MYIEMHSLLLWQLSAHAPVGFSNLVPETTGDRMRTWFEWGTETTGDNMRTWFEWGTVV